MPRAIPTLFICLALLSSQALSFGADGHRIVSHIAENHLSVKTALTINVITDGDSLAKLSVWPDRVRYVSVWEQSKYWHYVSIDDNEQLNDFPRHRDGDVLTALEYFYAELQNPQLPKKQQREALAFFVHFVGDIHQPLHVGRRDDRGGNSIPVKWLKQSKSSNLHTVWDSLIINTENKSPEQYSEKLDRSGTAKPAWHIADFQDWALESKVLRRHIYNFSPNGKRNPRLIGPAYIKRNKPIIERRLLMAGRRLADRLNRIFDPRGSDQQ
ncbi:S1/P1 nuclease [Porticoccaceae bacterium]|nr:S1/P1 nuclease [Porticoccaceae bacterium]